MFIIVLYVQGYLSLRPRRSRLTSQLLMVRISALFSAVIVVW